MSNTLQICVAGSGDALELIMPSGHTVAVPISDKGARFIYQVLTEQAKVIGKAQFGTGASPTQSQVDEWIKKNGLKKFESDGSEKKETLTLEDLGL